MEKQKDTKSFGCSKKNGVIQTGSVITSAGLILAGTFAVLGTLPIQVLVQFGIVTAIGVLLDTFIVRPLLVPAITVVLGRFAFWPGKLSRKSEEIQKSGCVVEKAKDTFLGSFNVINFEVKSSDAA
ncbi:MMPL family transporter [Bacillus paranthracis]